MTWDIKFIDAGRRPTGKPDPRYPAGMDLSVVADPDVDSCTRNLPYPAPQCGQYSIVCRSCGFTALVTVAGRADDPRTLRIPCKKTVLHA